ncbi:NUDIX hydrolase [Thalassoglobus polymorphus]|uniref:Nudix hydrolase n=1 Tax=Thalassoglobus polymorphus TaxID=2527994 RepID=A0A517QN11_9PLAN|nr:NUDIX domain-containing protein [Thalassoglobus polymorphus]QDT32995.1 Nudix hydrolase [Thalassoglobus polymorphus]
MAEEIFDVCDECDQVIGQAPRAEVHARGLLHRAVHIWIWRSDGRLMVHLRSDTKDQFPNFYTSSASGHLDAGEDYEQAAHRELKEELDLAGELTRLTKLPASPLTANEHSVLYEMITDEPPKPDPGEIAEVEYFTRQELLQLLDTKPDKLTPPFRALLEWWFETQK